MDSAYATEVRRLLQTLARQNRDTDRKSFLITSAGRGEGKSTTCALLGIVAARVFRKRTLVLDGDLRRPAIHRLLGIPASPGLAEILQGSAPWDSVVRPTPIPELFVIPSGHVHGSMVEAYQDISFRDFLARLRKEYDLIFIDSAPIVPVVEPLLMAEHTDGVLIVAMAGRTPLSLVRRMRQIMAHIENKIAGVILNNATEGLPYYYDYRYYGYEPESRRRLRPQGHRSGRHQAPPEEPAHTS